MTSLQQEAHSKSTTWHAARGSARLCFAGRGLAKEREDAARQLVPPNVEIAWLRQCHSAEVREARAGLCGDGDALLTAQVDLALTVVTADCVPILLHADDQIAAVHAGWRGLAKRILAATVQQLDTTRPMTAWIGPAIGSCCYEVGHDVAQEVQAATPEEVIREKPGRHPHLDLRHAAAAQLRELGIATIEELSVCTRCASEGWWSYRRNGPGAGRNFACVWLTSG